MKSVYTFSVSHEIGFKAEPGEMPVILSHDTHDTTNQSIKDINHLAPIFATLSEYKMNN